MEVARNWKDENSIRRSSSGRSVLQQYKWRKKVIKAISDISLEMPLSSNERPPCSYWAPGAAARRGPARCGALAVHHVVVSPWNSFDYARSSHIRLRLDLSASRRYRGVSCEVRDVTTQGSSSSSSRDTSAASELSWSYLRALKVASGHN